LWILNLKSYLLDGIRIQGDLDGPVKDLEMQTQSRLVRWGLNP